ncbi:hypothetical protein BCR34DRAFT_572109 [Clohesyomyces aquaticus]|uniref:Uncharacterized protein n=1 Tax=Clohesyomyces aquaticus TaxID=1231657 RepID=A0A1Y1Z4T8_9PLEO|nr:hypothetical protein BCR34DRAFT_572109 [Clohesyomyces aquaticus]
MYSIKNETWEVKQCLRTATLKHYELPSRRVLCNPSVPSEETMRSLCPSIHTTNTDASAAIFPTDPSHPTNQKKNLQHQPRPPQNRSKDTLKHSRTRSHQPSDSLKLTHRLRWHRRRRWFIMSTTTSPSSSRLSLTRQHPGNRLDRQHSRTSPLTTRRTLSTSPDRRLACTRHARRTRG